MIRLNYLKKLLDSIAAYLKPIEIDFFYEWLTSQGLSKFHHSNLTYFLVAFEFEFSKLTLFILIQLGKFQNSLIRNVLIFYVKCKLIGGNNCGHKLFQILIIYFNVKLIFINFQSADLGNLIDVLNDILTLLFFFLLFTEGKILIRQWLKRKIYLS